MQLRGSHGYQLSSLYSQGTRLGGRTERASRLSVVCSDTTGALSSAQLSTAQLKRPRVRRGRHGAATRGRRMEQGVQDRGGYCERSRRAVSPRLAAYRWAPPCSPRASYALNNKEKYCSCIPNLRRLADGERRGGGTCMRIKHGEWRRVRTRRRSRSVPTRSIAARSLSTSVTWARQDGT